MSDPVPRNELAQFETIVQRKCSLQRQGHRKSIQNHRRRKKKHAGDKNYGSKGHNFGAFSLWTAFLAPTQNQKMEEEQRIMVF